MKHRYTLIEVKKNPDDWRNLWNIRELKVPEINELSIAKVVSFFFLEPTCSSDLDVQLYSMSARIYNKLLCDMLIESEVPRGYISLRWLCRRAPAKAAHRGPN
jgi:hypothetical protein